MQWQRRMGVETTHDGEGRRATVMKTAATLLLSRGVHPKVVSEVLGHADISITLRVYAM
jgi:site-specific recombinase XerD